LNRGHVDPGGHVPRCYPVEFRRKVLDLIEAGRPVADIAAQLGVTAQPNVGLSVSLCKWS
jgi:hypothetical protein